MKCYHGDVLSVNAANDTFHWLVEDEGKIVFVGNDLPERFQNAPRVELGEKALCPSFVDTHQHLASFSTFHAGLNVMDAASNREISDLIRDFVRRSSAKTLIAFGASPYSVAEGRLISRAELDAVCPDREMMVVKYDGHACIVNTPLLRKLEAKLSPLRGYHPDTGEMNQEAFFKVSDYITGSLSMIDLVKNLQNAVDFEASRGIGMVHTVSGVGFVANLDITMEQLFARSLKNGFQIRVFPQSLDVRAAVRRKLPRIGGCFACALDGCFGSHDAAMNEPYADDGTDGVLYYADEKVFEFCKKANRAGLQIESAGRFPARRPPPRYHPCLPAYRDRPANLPRLRDPASGPERLHQLEAGAGRISGADPRQGPRFGPQSAAYILGSGALRLRGLRRPLYRPEPDRLDRQGHQPRQSRPGPERTGGPAHVYDQRLPRDL